MSETMTDQNTTTTPAGEPLPYGAMEGDDPITIATLRELAAREDPSLRSLTPALVDDQLAEIPRWLDDASQDAADAHVQRGKDEVIKAGTVNGIRVVSAATVVEADRQLRQRYDQDLLTRGTTIEATLEATEARLDQAIRDEAELPREQGTAGDRSGGLMAEYVSAGMEDRLIKRLTNKTRTQVVALYRTATADSLEGRTILRFVERQEATGWEDVTLAADRKHDAQAVLDLRAAIAEKRSARVRPWLFTAKRQIQQAKRGVVFQDLLAHLRSGRGIATVKGSR